VCSKFVEGRAPQLLGDKYHPRCFRCVKCKRKFDGKIQIKLKKDELWCGDCAEHYRRDSRASLDHSRTSERAHSHDHTQSSDSEEPGVAAYPRDNSRASLDHSRKGERRVSSQTERRDSSVSSKHNRRENGRVPLDHSRRRAPSHPERSDSEDLTVVSKKLKQRLDGLRQDPTPPRDHAQASNPTIERQVLSPQARVARCERCSEPADGKIVRVSDKTWHASCFRCKNCDKVIDQKKALTKKGEYWCAACVAKIRGSTRRRGASKELLDSCVVVANKVSAAALLDLCRRNAYVVVEAQDVPKALASGPSSTGLSSCPGRLLVRLDPSSMSKNEFREKIRSFDSAYGIVVDMLERAPGRINQMMESIVESWRDFDKVCLLGVGADFLLFDDLGRPRTGSSAAKIVELCDGILFEGLITSLIQGRRLSFHRCVLRLVHTLQASKPDFLMIVCETTSAGGTDLGNSLTTTVDGIPSGSARMTVARFCSENRAMGCIRSDELSDALPVSWSAVSPTSFLQSLTPLLAACRSTPLVSERADKKAAPPTLPDSMSLSVEDFGDSLQFIFDTVRRTMSRANAATKTDVALSVMHAHCVNTLSQQPDDMKEMNSESCELVRDVLADILALSPDPKLSKFVFDRYPYLKYETGNLVQRLSKLMEIPDATASQSRSKLEMLHMEEVTSSHQNIDRQLGKTLLVKELDQLLSTLWHLKRAGVLRQTSQPQRQALVDEFHELYFCASSHDGHSCSKCSYNQRLSTALGANFELDLERMCLVLKGVRKSFTAKMKFRTVNVFIAKSTTMLVEHSTALGHDEATDMDSVEVFSAAEIVDGVLTVFVSESAPLIAEAVAFHVWMALGRGETWSRVASSCFGVHASASEAGAGLSPRVQHELATSSVRDLLRILQNGFSSPTVEDSGPWRDAWAATEKSIKREALSYLLNWPRTQMWGDQLDLKSVSGKSRMKSLQRILIASSRTVEVAVSAIVPILRQIVESFGLTPRIVGFLCEIDAIVRPESLREIAIRLNGYGSHFDDVQHLATAAKLEMLGINDSTARDAFGASLFAVASFLGPRLGGQPTQLRLPKPGKARLLAQYGKQYASRAMDSALFLLPIAVNSILLVTVSISQFGSLRLGLTERMALAAGVLLGYVASGIWNFNISSVLSVFRARSEFSLLSLGSLRFLLGVVLTALVLAVVIFIVTASITSPGTAAIVAGAASLICLMNNGIAIVVNSRWADQVLWRSSAALIVLLSQVLGLVTVLVLDQITNEPWSFVVGFAVADLVLLVAILVKVSRWRLDWTKAMPVTSAQLHEWHAARFSKGGDEQTFYSDFAARSQFADAVQQRIRQKQKLFAFIRPTAKSDDLVEKKASAYLEIEHYLLTWYHNFASETAAVFAFPEVASVKWDYELTSAIEAWAMHTKTEIEPRGGMLHAYCQAGAGYGIIYFLYIFLYQAFAILYLVAWRDDDSAVALFLPGVGNAAGTAYLWSLVSFVCSLVSLEFVLEHVLQRALWTRRIGKNYENRADMITGVDDFVSQFDREAKHMFWSQLPFVFAGVLLGSVVGVIGVLSTSGDDFGEAVAIWVQFFGGYLGVLIVLYATIFAGMRRRDRLVQTGFLILFVVFVVTLPWAVQVRSPLVIRLGTMAAQLLWGVVSLVLVFRGKSPSEPFVQSLVPIALSGQRRMSSRRGPTDSEIRELSQSLDALLEDGSAVEVLPSSKLGGRTSALLGQIDVGSDLRSCFPSKLGSNLLSAYANEEVRLFVVPFEALSGEDGTFGTWAYAAVGLEIDERLHVFVGAEHPNAEATKPYLVSSVAEALLHEYWEFLGNDHSEAVALECLLHQDEKREKQIPQRLLQELRRLEISELHALLVKRSKLAADYLGLDLRNWGSFTNAQRLYVTFLHMVNRGVICNPIANKTGHDAGRKQPMLSRTLAGLGFDADHLEQATQKLLPDRVHLVNRATIAASLITLSRHVQLVAAEQLLSRQLDPHRKFRDPFPLGETQRGPRDFQTGDILNPLQLQSLMESPRISSVYRSLGRLAFMALVADGEFDSEMNFCEHQPPSLGGITKPLATVVKPVLCRLAHLQRSTVNLMVRHLCLRGRALTPLKRFLSSGHDVEAAVCPVQFTPVIMWSLLDWSTALLIYHGDEVHKILVLDSLLAEEELSERLSSCTILAEVFFASTGHVASVVEFPLDPATQTTSFFQQDPATGTLHRQRFSGLHSHRPTDAASELWTSSLDDLGRDSESVVKIGTDGSARVQFNYHGDSFALESACYTDIRGVPELKRLQSMTVRWGQLDRISLVVVRVEISYRDPKLGMLVSDFDYSNLHKPPAVSTSRNGPGLATRCSTPMFVLEDTYGFQTPEISKVRWNWVDIWARRGLPSLGALKKFRSRTRAHPISPIRDADEELLIPVEVSERKLLHLSFSASDRSERLTGTLRSFIWLSWERGDLPGSFATLWDWHVLKKEHLLRDYFCQIGKGHYGKAIRSVERQMEEIASGISFDEGALKDTPLRVTRVGDLSALRVGGFLPRDLRAHLKLKSATDALLDIATPDNLFSADQTPSELDSDYTSDPDMLVAVLDSGTWPADKGGVSNARRDLVFGLGNSFTWLGSAEIGSWNRLKSFSLAFVDSMEYVPISGALFDGPNEFVLADVPYTLLFARKQRTTPAVIETGFLPILSVLARMSFCDKTLSHVDIVDAITSFYVYFQLFDWTYTWSSMLTRRAWRELVFKLAIKSFADSPEEFRPTPTEANMALLELSQNLLSLSRPINPKISVYQTSHHGPQALTALVAKRLFRSSLVVWDHGIFSKERAFYLSKTKFVPAFVRNVLVSFITTAASVILANADILSPCTSVNTPAWDLHLASRGAVEPMLAVPHVAERISPVFNGVDTELFQAPADLSGRDPIPTAVMLSHVMPLKDIKNAIRAARVVVDNLPPDQNYQLLIYGSLQRDPQYTSKCGELIVRLGLQDHVFLEGMGVATEVLRRAWIYLNSSRAEALPLAVVEAELSGVPTVCTDVGGSRSMTGDGRFGMVVPPCDPAALAAAQIELLFVKTPQEVREMARAARAYAVENFNMTRYLTEHAQHLMVAMARSAHARLAVRREGGLVAWPSLVRVARLTIPRFHLPDYDETRTGSETETEISVVLNRVLEFPVTRILRHLEQDHVPTREIASAPLYPAHRGIASPSMRLSRQSGDYSNDVPSLMPSAVIASSQLG
jgi:glycosyltransferase involved in cell wall biosynthesis